MKHHGKTRLGRAFIGALALLFAAQRVPGGEPSVPAATWQLPSAIPVPVTSLIELFNGQNLDGWIYLAAGQPATLAEVCSVKDR